MNNEPLVIKKRGEDGYRVISLRISMETLEKLDELAKKTNRSRNELMNLILEHGVDNVKIET